MSLGIVFVNYVMEQYGGVPPTYCGKGYLVIQVALFDLNLYPHIRVKVSFVHIGIKVIGSNSVAFFVFCNNAYRN